MNATFKMDQDAATVGEMVSGSLSIKAIKTIQTTSLNIRFHGKELTSAIVGASTIKDNDTFLNLKVPIADEDLKALGSCRLTRDAENDVVGGSGRIKPGLYKVPFRFRLPPDIPSSCQLGEYESQASIVYTLRTTFGAGAEDYQTKTQVPVHSAAAPPNLEGVTGMVEPSCQAISKNGLADKGKMYFGAKMTQTRLERGPKKKNPIRVAVINDSAAKLHRIELAMEQVAKWKVAGGNNKKVKPQQRIIVLSRTNSALPRKYASKIDETTRSERANDKNRKAQNEQEIKQAIHSSENNNGLALEFVLPTVPQSAADTQQTSKIHVSHNVVITLMTEGNKTNPIFRIPITIVRGNNGTTTTTSTELDAATDTTSPPASPTTTGRDGGGEKAKKSSSPKRRTIQLGPIKLL